MNAPSTCLSLNKDLLIKTPRIIKKKKEKKKEKKLTWKAWQPTIAYLASLTLYLGHRKSLF